MLVPSVYVIVLHCKVAIIWYELCFQDAITERAVQIIEDRSTDNPLFLFVAYHAPHIPLQVLTSPPETPCSPLALCFSQDATNKCPPSSNRFLSGIYRCTIPQMTTLRIPRLGKPSWVRNAELCFFIILRFARLSCCFPNCCCWGRWMWWCWLMSYFQLAMMTHLDDGVGRIVEAVKDADMEDNTLIVFLSDVS